MKIYSNYINTCKKRIAKIVVGSILLIINTVIAIVLPRLLNNSINFLFKLEKGEYSSYLLLFSLYIVLFISQSVINYLSTIWFKKIGNDNAEELAENIVSKIIDAEKKNPTQIRVKDTMIVITGDVFNLGETGILLLYKCLYNIINILVMLYYMLFVGITLSILVIIVVSVLLYFQNKLNKIIEHKIMEVRKTSGEYYYVSNTIVEQSEEHRRNGAKRYIIDKYKDKIELLLVKKIEFAKLTNKAQLMNSWADIISQAFIFLLGAAYVLSGEMLLSELITFNIFAGTFSNYLLQIPGLLIQKKDFDISCKRVNEMLDIKTYDNDINVGNQIEYINQIKFENVSYGFGNNSNKIIDKFTHVLETGKTFCIVGPNGCGKTTLIGILNGDYEIDEGKIYIDGQYINNHKQKCILDNLVSTFSANSILYNDSIKNNIILERPIDIKMVNFICKILRMDEWINSLENGIDTEIAELKDNLSDGQKQKIALARFLVKVNQVIIMDEIEKNLDKETKESVLNYLISIKINHIIVLVSHDNFIKTKIDEIIFM